MAFDCVYNEAEFPTALAFGHTRGCGGEGESLAGRSARATPPEGAGGNAGASRTPKGAHWKGNDPPGWSRLFVFFP